MTAKASENHTQNGEGVEVLKNEPYDDGVNKGQYTHKVIHLAQKIPSWCKTLMPSLKTLSIEEKAWNSFPYCKTVYSSDFFKERFHMEIVTLHVENDRGQQENVHKLSESELKQRKVDVVDIAYDAIEKSKYKAEEDPTIFLSTKTGRGKLGKDWKENSSVVMCAYKLVKVKFKYFGFQGRVEKFIHDVAIRSNFVLLNRQAFCWIDQWLGMTMKDIREMEKIAAENLAKALHGNTKVEEKTQGGTEESSCTVDSSTREAVNSTAGASVASPSSPVLSSNTDSSDGAVAVDAAAKLSDADRLTHAASVANQQEESMSQSA